MFHYITQDEMTYICLSEIDYRISLAKKFLKELKRTFLKDYSKWKIQKSSAYSLKRFNKKILNLMEYYNSEEVDKLKRCKREVNELKEKMLDNIEKLLDKEEKVELLVLKTKTMSV